MPIRHRFCTIALTAISLSLAVEPSLAQPQGGDCSYLVINRSYANQFNGFLNVPVYFGSLGFPAPPFSIVPNGGAGVVTFLPNGIVNDTETIAIGNIGLDKDTLIQGTYSLKWDTTKNPVVCSGTMSGVAQNGLAFNFNLIVSQDGEQVQMVHTDPGLIVQTTAFPMNTEGCHNRIMNGTYSYSTNLWALMPPGVMPQDETLAGYIPGVMSGVMDFHAGVNPSPEFSDAPSGSAAVDAWDTPSMDGMIMPRAMTGWYKVGKNCTGILFLHDSLGNDFHLEVFIGRNGKSLFLANIDLAPWTADTPLYTLGMTLNRSGDKSEK